MSNVERDLILAEALRKYGYPHQITVTVEELSELTKALCKVVRYGITEDNTRAVLEELADVFITCRQVMMMLDISESALQLKAAEKLLRLSKTMDYEYHKCDPVVSTEEPGG